MLFVITFAAVMRSDAAMRLEVSRLSAMRRSSMRGFSSVRHTVRRLTVRIVLKRIRRSDAAQIQAHAVEQRCKLLKLLLRKAPEHRSVDRVEKLLCLREHISSLIG